MVQKTDVSLVFGLEPDMLKSVKPDQYRQNICPDPGLDKADVCLVLI